MAESRVAALRDTSPQSETCWIPLEIGGTHPAKRQASGSHNRPAGRLRWPSRPSGAAGPSMSTGARQATRTGRLESRLLSVSAAARLLGVSSSSLRAWAAAGRVPHVRTPGGHRRFELDELVRWLAERGGAPPAPQQRLQELVPTRRRGDARDRRRPSPPRATTCSRRSRRSSRAPGPGGADRPSSARQTRVLGALESLAEALDAGDLAGCYRDAEWEGFRHGASGQPGDAPVTEALALRRAVDRVLGPRSRRPPTARPWSAPSTGWPCGSPRATPTACAAGCGRPSSDGRLRRP